jgi:hypothetical protein
MWVQIPTVQLDEVNLTELPENSSTKWAFNNGNWTNQGVGNKYIITRTLTFEAKDQAEGYNISVVDNNNAVHWIYVTKNNDGYDISYAETGSAISASGIYAKSQDNVYTTMVENGSIRKGGSLELPYKYTGLTIQSMSATNSELKATLSLSDDGKTFTLALPDVIGYCDDGTAVTSTGVTYLRTSQVSVQAVVYPKTDADGNVLESGYISSRMDIWSADLSSGSTSQKTVDAKVAAPTIGNALNCEDAGNDYKFTYNISGEDGTKLVSQILVTDASDKLIEVRYNSAEFTIPKTSFTYTQSDTTVERKVQIRFAKITDSGISEWTSWYELANDGTLTKEKKVMVSADAITAETMSEIWENQSDNAEGTTTELPAAEGSITEVTTTEQTTESTETENTTTERNTMERSTTENTTTEQSTTEKNVTESSTTESATTEGKRTDDTVTETSVTETSE